MLRSKYYFIILLALLVLLNISYAVDVIKLVFVFISLLLSDFAFASSQMSFELLDSFFSVIGPAAIIVYLLFSKAEWLYKKISWLTVVCSLLAAAFLFPSLITSEHPDFYSNLSKTRLLPPFSKVYNTKADKKQTAETEQDRFIELKNEIIPSAVKERSSEVGEKIFLLGTDEFGRDIFTRIIYGTRISFIIGVLAVLVTLLIGVSLGFAAGISGGIIDTIFNRIAEMFLSIPMIFLVILFAAFFGSSLWAVIILLGFSGWMSLFKIVRGELLLIKKKDWFISSKMLGYSNFFILLYEVIPIVSVPVVINLVFQFGNVILAEAALSYLGLGSGNSYPSWGGMIQQGQGYIYSAWWMIVFPGVLLFISLYIINSLGKKLSFYFNPRLMHDK